MALTKLTDNLRIIASLPDEPNDNDGLSAQELKNKFDLASLLIQEFINDSLIPEAEDAIAAAALGVTQNGVSTEYINNDAVTDDKLCKTTGAEAVVTNAIRNNAVTEEKLSSALRTLLTTYGNSINSVSSTVTSQGVSISNLQSGLSTTNDTVSGKQAKHKTGTVTLSSGVHNWSNLAIPGVTASNTVVVSPAPSSYAQWVDNRVRCSGQGDSKLSFTADTNTSAAITVNVLILD